MFNIGSFEVLLICVIALLVLGPERLPGAVRTAGLWIGRFRRSFYKVKSEIERELNADEIRRQLHNESVMADIEDAKNEVQTVKKGVEESANRIVNSANFDPGASNHSNEQKKASDAEREAVQAADANPQAGQAMDAERNVGQATAQTADLAGNKAGKEQVAYTGSENRIEQVSQAGNGKRGEPIPQAGTENRNEQAPQAATDNRQQLYGMGKNPKLADRPDAATANRQSDS